MSTIADVAVSFTVIRCSKCSVRFGLDREFLRDRRNDQQTFYCPNGHQRWFPPGDSDADRLRKELAEANRLVANVRNDRDYAYKQLQDTSSALTVKKRLLTRTKNELTKVRTRVAAGVCPDCNRTFQDVARHMKSKHGGTV